MTEYDVSLRTVPNIKKILAHIIAKTNSYNRHPSTKTKRGSVVLSFIIYSASVSGLRNLVFKETFTCIEKCFRGVQGFSVLMFNNFSVLVY